MNKEYKKLSRNALKSMYITSVIVNAIIIAILIAVWRIFFSDKTWAAVVAIILTALLVLEVMITPYIRYRRYRYAIDEECIDIIEGMIFIERNIVPIERLHKIAVIRGPIDRALGLGKVSVTTAGGDVEIRFLEMEKADKIAESLKHRINQIAVETKNGQ